MDLAVTKNWKMKDFPLKCQKKPENITVTVWNLTDSIRDQEDDLIRAVRNDDAFSTEILNMLLCGDLSPYYLDISTEEVSDEEEEEDKPD